MPSSLRRPALALGLALGLHALPVVAVLLSSTPHIGGDLPASAGPARPFTLSLVSLAPPARPRSALPPLPEWIPEAFEPVVHTSGPSVPMSLPTASTPGDNGGAESPGGGAGAGGAKTAPPKLLAAPDTARRVVYVLDRSMSMGHTGALARARREVAAAVRHLPPDARFQIIVYSRFAEPLVPGGWLAPSDETARAVERSLAELSASGGTGHVPALRKALQLRPDLVFLVTDADDLNPADVAAVTRLNLSRAVIHVVELATGRGAPGDGPLPRLARLNGGSHRRVCPDS